MSKPSKSVQLLEKSIHAVRHMPTRTWTFKSYFRREAYGWKGTALASKRMREAVSEIKKVAKKDPALAGEGVIELFVRLYPALMYILQSMLRHSGQLHLNLQFGVFGSEIRVAETIPQSAPQVKPRLYGQETRFPFRCVCPA